MWKNCDKNQNKNTKTNMQTDRPECKNIKTIIVIKNVNKVNCKKT